MASPGMADPLQISLDVIAAVMPVDPPWWIIGSTALVLSGVDLEPRDVDVFASFAIIEAARLKLGAAAMAPRPDAQFRSSPYFQVRPEGGLEIDFMGDLQVFSEGAWAPLVIESRQAAGPVFIPSLDEQARVLRLFGRPKDLARLSLFQN